MQDWGRCRLVIRSGLTMVLLVAVSACNHLSEPGAPEAPTASLVLGSDAEATPLELAEQQLTADIRDQMLRVQVALTFRAPVGRELTDGVFRLQLPPTASVSFFSVSTGDGGIVAAQVVERRRVGGILAALEEKSRSSVQLSPVAPGLFEVRLGRLPPQLSPRLELTYTEFLPLQGGAYTCSLPRAPAGVPETLRLRVHSATPLRTVDCSLPTAQIRRGRSSALIDYRGKGGIDPFRVDLSPEVAAASLVACGYEKGSDGYFLLLANAPSAPLTGLRLEANGLRVAGLYPQSLPDLPQGGQLVVLGRYQPPARGSAADLVLHGLRGGQPVRLEAPLRRAEDGLSFIPRLWAQRHLKAQLAQPQTEDLVAGIVELSKEFFLLTPYTTFLVLDSGNDGMDGIRDQGLRRRLRPSNGAWFFAAGKERARLDTLRQQQRVADDAWAEFRLEALRPLFGFRWAWNRLGKPSPTRPRPLQHGGSPTLGMELRLVAAVTAWEEMDRAVAQSAAQPLPPAVRPRPEPLPGEPLKRIDRLSGGGPSANWQEPPPAACELLGLPRGEVWSLGNRRWTEPMAAALEPPKPVATVLPAEARAVTRELLCLPRLTGPVLIGLVSEKWGAQPTVKATERRVRLLLAPDRWLLVENSLSRGGASRPRSLQWRTGKERGVLVPSRGLGVSRAPLPVDSVPLPVVHFWGSFRDLASIHGNDEKAKVERLGEDRLRLTLGGTGYGHEYLIDPVRRVVLRRQEINRSLPQSPSLFVLSDFVEAGGCWWPGRMEWRTSGNAMEQRTTFTVRALDAVAFERLWEEAFGEPKASLVLPFPSAPRRALISAWREGALTVPQRYAFLRHFIDTAQWAAAEKQRAALANAGVPELALQEARDAIVLGTQGSEEWLARLLGRAQRLAAEPQADELAVALPWLSQAQRTVGAEEQLRLIDAVTPIFSRQPQWMQSKHRLRRLRATALQAAGRRAEAAALLAQKNEESSATPLPGGISGNLGLGLSHHRQDVAALDARVLAYGLPAGRRDTEAEAQLHQYCETQIRRGRPAAALAMLGEWRRHVARVPEALPETPFGSLDHNGHYHYLLALAREGREDEAFALAATWLQRPISNAAVSPQEQAEAKAAVRFAFTGPWLEMPPYVDSCLDDLLLDTGVAALRRPDLEWLVSSIEFFGSWGYWGRREAFWSARLVWQKEKDEARKIVSTHPMAPFWEFLTELRRDGLAEAEEGHALAMVAGLGLPEQGERASADRVNALAQVVDAMVQSRSARLLRDDMEARRLVARDLEVASADALRQARIEVAERLRDVGASTGPSLLPWLALERQWLELLAGDDSEALARECWQALGMSPPPAGTQSTWLQALPMAQRLTILKRLCLAGRLPPEQVEALLAYLAKGAAREPQARVWKLHQLSLLLALDRQEELETRLLAWVRDEPAEPTWHIALGYLLARHNRLAEAIVQFETAAEPFGLPAREARLLSAWRMLVAPVPEPAEDAPPPSRPDFARLSRPVLYRLLMADAAKTGLALTSAETREILLRLAHHAGRRREVFGFLAKAYGRNRDPRLLAIVADLLREAQLPEPFVLAKMVHGLLTRLNDEAAAGTLAQAVRSARPGLTGERLLAADLVDLVCAPMLATAGRLKAAELEQTVARLERVAVGCRERGSAESLASFLLDWGAVAAGPLRQALTHWLAELMADPEFAQASSRRNLRLAYAKLLWGYEQRDAASRILELALADPIDLPGSHHYWSRDPVLDTAVGYLCETAQFRRCESMLRNRLAQAAESGEKARLEEDLAAFWVQAISGRQAVQAGTGQALYDAAHRQLRAWLDTAAGPHFAKLVKHLCALYMAAHREGCKGVPERLEALSLALPAMLSGPLVGFRVQDTVGTVAAARHQILGPRAALDFLLGWIEREPRRLRYENNEGWGTHAEIIATWKREIGADAALERRMGALACRELRMFLHRNHENWQPGLHYQRGGLLFREDLVPDFAAAAEAECRANPAADFVAMQAAHYLGVELRMPGRAAAVLAEAEGRGRLGFEGRLARVRYTLAADHAAEAATLARRLATDLHAAPLGLFIEVKPLDAQVLWLGALAAADDGPGFSAALVAIETGLSRQGARRLKEVTRLAQTCLGCERSADAVRLFEDALVLHRLTARFDKESPPVAALEEGLQAARAGGR